MNLVKTTLELTSFRPSLSKHIASLNNDVIQTRLIGITSKRTSTTKAFLHNTPEEWSGIELRDGNVKCFIKSVSEARHKAM